MRNILNDFCCDSCSVECSLVDSQRLAPANLNHFYGGAADQACSVTSRGKRDKTPVLSIASRQDFTSDWHTGEGSGGEHMSVRGGHYITSCDWHKHEGGKGNLPEAHYGIRGSVISAVILSLAKSVPVSRVRLVSLRWYLLSDANRCQADV